MWVYSLLREISEIEKLNIISHFQHFLLQWKSHGDRVVGEIELFHNQFIVVKYTENGAIPSGCSIDGMKHAVEKILEEAGMAWADGARVFYRNSNGKITHTDFRSLPSLLDSKEITAETKVFDYLNGTGEMELAESWMRRYI
jgi:hypothetical protein